MLRSIKAWVVLTVCVTIVIVAFFVWRYSTFQTPTHVPNQRVADITTSMFSDPLKMHNGEIEVSSFLPLNTMEPFMALVEAMKFKKGSTRFRVTWSDIEPGGPFGGTMVYDRKRKLIKLYDENWFHGSYYRFQYLITGVTDELIFRYVTEHSKFPMPYGMGFYSFISIFRTHGCTVYRIERRFKGTYANQKPWWPDIDADINQASQQK